MQRPVFCGRAGDPVIVDAQVGTTTIQITMTAADPGDPVKGRRIAMRCPHRRHGDRKPPVPA